MKNESPAEITRRANALARQHGWGRATAITTDPDHPEGVVEADSWRWRKNSNGQKVPNAYVRKAWRSVHYSHAYCTVNIHPHRFALPSLPEGRMVRIGDWAKAA